VKIRPAREDDVELIFSLIVELAEYEREPDAVTGTPQMLSAALFGEKPAAEAVIGEVDGEAVGFALYHRTFSTWECNEGLWLEDLYVRPEHRRARVGEALVRHLAAVAVRRGYTRLEWAALEWNDPALRFYEKLGAQVMERWLMHRLEGAGLRSLAAGTGSGNREAPPGRGFSVADL